MKMSRVNIRKRLKEIFLKMTQGLNIWRQYCLDISKENF